MVASFSLPNSKFSFLLFRIDSIWVVKNRGQCHKRCDIACLDNFAPICAGPPNSDDPADNVDFSNECQLRRNNCGKESSRFHFGCVLRGVFDAAIFGKIPIFISFLIFFPPTK